MKKIPKKIIQISIAVFIGAVLSIGASYVSALTARPADINTNAPNAIDVSSTGQTKGDPANSSGGQLSLKNLIVGFISNTSSTESSPVNYSRINDLGYMSVGRYAPGTGVTLDIKGFPSGAKGTIRALRLAHTEDVKVPLCAGLTGTLELCGENLEFLPKKDSNGKYESGLYSLIIPEGVSTLKVTLKGAGGAGYGENNKNNYADDGDASFFSGDDVYLVANGGQGASSFVSSAQGGNPVVSISNGKDVTGSVTSSSGGVGEVTSFSYIGSSSLLKTGTCNNTTYYVVKGGIGNGGGKGGASYQGSQAVGGTAGPSGPISGSGWNFIIGGDAGGTSIDCNQIDQTSDDFEVSPSENNRIGGNGKDGADGDGGSGFGGQGGASALTDASDCSNLADPFLCVGGISASGGGAGAYINATINVNPGEIFYIKAGRGGVPQYDACTSGNYSTIMYCKKSKIGGGAISGKGGNGKVTIEFDYTS